MAAPDMPLALATTKSPRRPLGDVLQHGDNSNDNCRVQTEQQLTVPQTPSSGLTTTEHALRLDLPRIDATNAARYPPADLNKFRAATARAPADSAPALWFWQMTGDEWPRDGHSYELAKKRHRRMVSKPSDESRTMHAATRQS